MLLWSLYNKHILRSILLSENMYILIVENWEIVEAVLNMIFVELHSFLQGIKYEVEVNLSSCFYFVVEFIRCRFYIFSILREFHSLQMSNTGNWMHIRYQSKLQARKALSKDGRIFGESIMIGVKPCIDKVSYWWCKESSLICMKNTRPRIEIGGCVTWFHCVSFS